MSIIFYIRIHKEPTSRSHPERESLVDAISRSRGSQTPAIAIPWRKQLYVLYLVSILIMIRSVFRIVEYLQGTDGYIMTHEAFLYIFDATMMIATVVILNVIHPSQITGFLTGRKATRALVRMQTMKKAEDIETAYPARYERV